MSDLISRQAVKDIILSGVSTDTNEDKEYVCSLIDNLPPVENKGEWIDNGNGSYTCSKCKTEWTTSQIEKMCFCPTCGADMR